MVHRLRRLRRPRNVPNATRTFHHVFKPIDTFHHDRRRQLTSMKARVRQPTTRHRHDVTRIDFAIWNDVKRKLLVVSENSTDESEIWIDENETYEAIGHEAIETRIDLMNTIAQNDLYVAPNHPSIKRLSSQTTTPKPPSTLCIAHHYHYAKCTIVISTYTWILTPRTATVWLLDGTR
jgi:hypothetical protein